jgi:hypothetical protein
MQIMKRWRCCNGVSTLPLRRPSAGKHNLTNSREKSIGQIPMAYPGIFFRGEGGWVYARIFLAGSTNSVEERGQRERGSGGGSPLVRGSTRFANE